MKNRIGYVYLSSLSIYLLVILILYGYNIFSTHTWVFVNQVDSNEFINYMAWWRYAILHLKNPFIDTTLYSGNVNMMYATSSPLLALISAPVSFLFGPVAAFNFVSVISMPLSAFTTFILVYYLSKSYVGSLLGGFVFGFSTYLVLTNFVGDVNVSSIYLVPLAVYLVVRFMRKEVSTKWFVIFMSLLLSMQFLISTEVYATLTAMGFITLFIYYLFYRDKRVFTVSIYSLLSYLISTILIFPFVYYALKHKYYIVYPPQFDLFSMFTPNAIGANIFMLICALLYIRKFRSYFLPTLLLIFSVSSSFYLFKYLPLLKDAQPARLIAYIDLVFGIMIGLYFSKVSTKSRYVLASYMFVILIAFLTLFSSYENKQYHVPYFFKSAYKSYVNKGSELLVLPLTLGDAGLVYQAIDNFYYKMPVGYYWNVSYTMNKLYNTHHKDYFKYGTYFYKPKGYPHRLLNYLSMFSNDSRGFKRFLKKNNVKYIAVVCKVYSKKIIDLNYSYYRTRLSLLKPPVNACNLFKFSYKHVRIKNTVLYYVS